LAGAERCQPRANDAGSWYVVERGLRSGNRSIPLGGQGTAHVVKQNQLLYKQSFGAKLFATNVSISLTYRLHRSSVFLSRLNKTHLLSLIFSKRLIVVARLLALTKPPRTKILDLSGSTTIAISVASLANASAGVKNIGG